MDYKKDIANLRKLYVEATLDQRLHVAFQRIANTNYGPDMIVAHVSAIEGFARALAMRKEATTKEELSKIYSKYRNKKPKELIESYLKEAKRGKPETFFGDGVWEILGYAIEYRNLLAHECTYLGQDIYPDLIDSCLQVLSKLAEAEGLKLPKQ